MKIGRINKNKGDINMRKYHLSDILSITTGKLVSIKHIDGVYDILNYLTGVNLYTNEIPRALKECKVYLLEQFPQLKEVNADGVNGYNIYEWVESQIKIFGEYLEVDKLPVGIYEYKEPKVELAETMKKSQTIITQNISDFLSN
jgi:hypothetical protein